ncbi:hypothetical protein MKK65_26505 [Methylobacterium sp. J-001]|jgi:hypothetical protein|uniref:hypothetical protein n=1 Tax=Methylobacterium sp. J-001 TaxID=2836609 RepID=UPI001FBA4656|nr:hypothetical protein [Methylobacterium sp. J-001]MCJ2120082.1 hypothetical protein [Methylobacterium sp. J-001]
MMMPSPDLERFAAIIADNVVSAFERERDGAEFHRTGRETAVSVIVRYLLAALPTTSSDALAAACNRGLDDVVGAMGLSGPRVEGVDPDDGSVTLT